MQDWKFKKENGEKEQDCGCESPACLGKKEIWKILILRVTKMH